MKYVITIDYAGNEQKAAKLTLTSSQGQVLLEKVPVAMPLSDLQSISGNYFPVKTSYAKNESLSRNFEYEQAFDKLSSMGLKKSITLGNTIIIPNMGADKLSAVKDAMVVKENAYSQLNKITSTDQVEVNLNAVRFLWMPEKINRLDISIEPAILNLNKAEKEATTLAKKTIADISSANNSVGSKDTTRVAPKVKAKNRPYNQNNDYSISNNIDAMDILFMYNYPSLAPMYKPNSILAWAMFFNNDNNQVSAQAVQQNINQITGFENVAQTEVKYTPSGYSVNMYEDEQKTNKLGTMVFDGQNNSYVLQAPNGHQATLNIDDSGTYTGEIMGGTKGVTSFEFVKNNDGLFQGNWQSESDQGVKLSSGVSLSSDFAPSSSPFEPVDVLSVLKQTQDFKLPDPVMQPDFTPNVSPDFTPEPTPMTSSWTSSSDSYSNSGSFSP